MTIPNRWLDYSPMGEKIPETRFIAMKVPLKDSICIDIDENEKFTCQMAIEAAKRKGYVLGLVIDLSFTKRYYDPNDFIDNEVKYKKIFMEGRVLPSYKVMSQFYETVKRFKEENEGNESLIAVHCTHGLNRTGYMICRFLIDERNYKPQSAIDVFNLARGHDMERELYLNDLLGKPCTEMKRNISDGVGDFIRTRIEPLRYGQHPVGQPYPPQPRRNGGNYYHNPQQNYYQGSRGFWDDRQNRGPVPVQCYNWRANHVYDDRHRYNDFGYSDHRLRGQESNSYHSYSSRGRSNHRQSPYGRQRNDW